jgi:hypothetical protein
MTVGSAGEAESTVARPVAETPPEGRAGERRAARRAAGQAGTAAVWPPLSAAAIWHTRVRMVTGAIPPGGVGRPGAMLGWCAAGSSLQLGDATRTIRAHRSKNRAFSRLCTGPSDWVSVGRWWAAMAGALLPS